MERKYAQRLKKSFQQTILDTPVPKLSYSKKSKLIKALPRLLVPKKAEKPVPKPRVKKPVPKPRVLSKRPVQVSGVNRWVPVPVPRSTTCPKPINNQVKEFIAKITPYYRPEAIIKFDKELKDKNIYIY